ncbi:hypothetical protein JXA80_11875, partial [bacterium]|nr:hypothetical protein [candidate division CSSED10-310 bacterium]
IDDISPCIDAGSTASSSVYFVHSSGMISLDQMVTDPLGSLDSGTVDMGFHYMNPALFTPTPGPTQVPTATPFGNCADPELLDIGDCVCGSTVILSSDHDCGYGHSGPDRVYRIEVPSPGGILTLQGRADFDADWSISTSCGTGADIVCIDGTEEPVPDPECSYVTPNALGDMFYSWQGSGVFYIWVDGFHSWDSGNYCFQVTLGACTPTPSPPPTATPTSTPTPRDIYVPGDYPSIREAIDAAWHKDKIHVADGVWNGPDNTNLTFAGKKITVESENGPSVCIIDGGGIARAFTFTMQETNKCILSGFHIRNCVDSAILCQGTYPLITNCVFTDNTSASGGALRCEDSADPSVINCLFEGNSAVFNGGAVAIYSMSFPSFTVCTFTGNTAQGVGGAMALEDDAAATVTYCIGWGDSAGDGDDEVSVDDSYLDMTYSNFEAPTGTYPGSGNLNENPLFQSGPLGDRYLLDEGALLSPCIDAGNVSSHTVCFNASSARCLNTMTTHITGTADFGMVDLGFHYELVAMPTFTPEPTGQPWITPTPTPDCINHGDVNFSGALTAADAQMIFNIVLGFIAPTVEEACAADCNGSGTITASDSQTVFYAVLGMGSGCMDLIP